MLYNDDNFLQALSRFLCKPHTEKKYENYTLDQLAEAFVDDYAKKQISHIRSKLVPDKELSEMYTIELIKASLEIPDSLKSALNLPKPTATATATAAAMS